MRRVSLYLLYLIVVCAVFLEIVFRVLPVSDSLEIYPVDEDNPIIHFKENRALTLQTGFDFSHVVEKRVNNFGFLTNTTFDEGRSSKKKRVVVIGDSFVEAVQVANEDTFHGLLHKNKSDIEVYPLGASGSPLSQYLAFAGFAERILRPDYYVFLIIKNDFDESWLKYKNAPSFHYFDDEELLVRRDYEPSALKRLARLSAFVRYLYLDLKIEQRVMAIWNRFNTESNLEGSHISTVNELIDEDQELERLRHMLRAVEIFLNGLREIVGDKPVLLVLDGNLSAIYERYSETRPRESHEDQAFHYLQHLATEQPDTNVLDLHPVFYQEWIREQERFDYTYDRHWSENGHRIAARAILASGFLDD